MRIDELFDLPPGKLQRIDPKIVQRVSRMTDIVATWKFSVGEHNYVIYFDQCANIANQYNCGFVIFDGEVSHSTDFDTSFKDSLMVLTNAVEALRLFIVENNPDEVSFTGFSRKQQALYLKMVTRFKRELPSGYIVKMPGPYEDRIRIQKIT